MIPRLILTAAAIAAALWLGTVLAAWVANLEPEEKEEIPCP